MRIIQKIKSHFEAVLRTKTSPHSIALGFAIGNFIGVLPTPGFGIILGILIVLIFRKINKYALFGAMVIWNPITLGPVYWMSYSLGDALLGAVPAVSIELTILDQIYRYSQRFLLGNMIIACTSSAFSYFLMRRLVRWYRNTKK